MSTANLEKIRRIPGRLALGPTQAGLLLDYPHGGTALGTVEEVRWRIGLRHRDAVAEEWLETVEVHRVAEFPVFAFVLMDWDADVLSRVFPVFTTGTGPAGYQGSQRISGGASPGKHAALDPILFSPFDARAPGIILHRPILQVEDSAELRLALGELAAFPLVLKPTRTSSTPARSWQCDLLEQLEVGP